MNEILTFREFLAWVGTPVGMTALGGAVSAILRDVEWFNSLSRTQKSLFMGLLCIFVLPLLLVYLPAQLTANTINTIEPFFNAILLGVGTYAGSQVTHEFWNSRVEERRDISQVREDMLSVSEEFLRDA